MKSFLFWTSLAFLVVGCGKPKPPPDPVVVKGTVVDKTGKAVGNRIVSFTPEGPNHPGEAASVPANAKGQYETKLVPGTYKVVVRELPNQGNADSNDPTAGMTPKPGAEVSKKGSNPLIIPTDPYGSNIVTVPEGGLNEYNPVAK